MRTLAHVGWVFLGGGVGSVLRYGVGRAALALVGTFLATGLPGGFTTFSAFALDAAALAS